MFVDSNGTAVDGLCFHLPGSGRNEREREARSAGGSQACGVVLGGGRNERDVRSWCLHDGVTFLN